MLSAGELITGAAGGVVSTLEAPLMGTFSTTWELVLSPSLTWNVTVRLRVDPEGTAWSSPARNATVRRMAS